MCRNSVYTYIGVLAVTTPWLPCMGLADRTHDSLTAINPNLGAVFSINSGIDGVYLRRRDSERARKVILSSPLSSSLVDCFGRRRVLEENP